MRYVKLPDSYYVFSSLDVHSFGAIGDGVADDTKALQDALNFGGRLVGKKGCKYRVTDTLIGRPGTVLENIYLLLELKHKTR